MVRIIYLILFLSGYCSNLHAVVGSKNADHGYDSIVYITFSFKNMEDDNACTGFLINDHQVITVAHCAIHDENGFKSKSASVCIGKQFPFNRPGEGCFESKNIRYLKNYKYATSTDFVIIELKEKVPLNFLGLEPIPILPNKFATRILNSKDKKRYKRVISFGSRNFNQPALGKKGVVSAQKLSWDFINGLWKVTVKKATYGLGDDGAGLLIKYGRRWYLMGLLAKTTPDFFVSVLPLFDPCLPPEPGPKQPSILMNSQFYFLSLNVLNCTNRVINTGKRIRTFCKATNKLSIQQLKRQSNKDKSGDIAFYLFQHAQTLQNKLRYLNQAANKNHSEALFDLSEVYRNGKGVRINIQKSEKLLLNSAMKGSLRAQYQLALLIRNHQIKHLKAMKTTWQQWIKRAAKNGYAPAQYELAKTYQNISKNKSYDWMMRSARQGYAPAQYGLYQYFSSGFGVNKNNYMAYKWKEYSAGQGYLPANQ